MQEEILDEGYFAIGRYSDHGVIVLKLTDDENKEGGVFLFDCETQEVKVLEPTFTEFLNQILHNPKPVLQEIKNWEKKMYKMEYYVINAKFLWRNVTNVKKSIIRLC